VVDGAGGHGAQFVRVGDVVDGGDVPAVVDVEGDGGDHPAGAATIACLWWGSLHRTPVMVVLVKEADSTRSYDIALVSTDTDASVETLVSRYADRWSVEQSIKDSKILIGAGDAANRLPLAVHRSVPFAMPGLTILVLWYAGHGTAETDLAAARARAPWNRKKTHVSVDDMLIAFRRARITAIGAGQDTLDHYPAGAVTSSSAAA
jgi:hypothetical protein